MTSRGRNTLLLSAFGHVAVALLAIALSPRDVPPVAPRPDPGVDVELFAPPPTPERSAPPVESAHVAATEAHTPAARSAHRAVPHIETSVGEIVSPMEPPIESSSVAPPSQTWAPVERARPAVTAEDLYANAARDVRAAAAAGIIDPGTPGSGYRPSRDLFGPHDTRSQAERARDAAMGPTLAALAETDHMRMAGAGVHDAAVARRAGESFVPVRTVANLGRAVLAAPVVGLPPVDHTPGGAELAATEGLDGAHAQSFTMMQMRSVPPPASHLLRADVEVDQDATGAVRATRVVRASGVATFDAEALRAIREAMPEVQELQLREGRRSRWSFEVSESQGTASSLIGGGNDGWQMIPEQSNGVHLRYRVRMLRSQTWQGT